MTDSPAENPTFGSAGMFLVVGNLPPELECNFEHVVHRLVLSVNAPFLAGSPRSGEQNHVRPLSAADKAIVHQEVELWIYRMKQFYPAFLIPYLRLVGRRAAKRYLALFRELTDQHRELCYVSWGYKDLSTGVARHFIPDERRAELENGFFRPDCLSVTNKELIKRLGIETIIKCSGGRRMKSRFKVLQPQFWEDGVTYYQAMKRRLFLRRGGAKAMAADTSQNYDLLIALQLDFDSATVENGNGWNSLRLLDYISEIRRGESVLVRVHPFEKNIKVKYIRRRSARYGFDFSANTLNQDLAMSRYVVTINSSMIGECITSGKPFFYGGVIPDDLRNFGLPVEAIRPVLDGDLEPVIRLSSEPLNPGRLTSHIEVRSQ